MKGKTIGLSNILQNIKHKTSDNLKNLEIIMSILVKFLYITNELQIINFGIKF